MLKDNGGYNDSATLLLHDVKHIGNSFQIYNFVGGKLLGQKKKKKRKKGEGGKKVIMKAERPKLLSIRPIRK